jgi:microcystin-dependent protein
VPNGVSLNLPDLKTLAAEGNYAVFTVLSAFSAVLLLSASRAFLHNPRFWTGAGFPLTDAELDEIDELVSEAEYELMQNTLGLVMPTVQYPLPSWMLECDGATYQRVDYPDLYAILDQEWRSGPDAFIVPNLLDRFVMAAGNDFDVGESGGEINHTLTTGEMPAHTHTYRSPLVGITDIGPGVPIPNVTGQIPNTPTGNAGGGQPHNNMPPYFILRWVIISGRPV